MHTRTTSDAWSTTFINSSRRSRLDWRPCFSPDTIQSAALIAMRYLSLVLVLVIVMLPLALGQTTLDRALEAQLKRVFPAATAFSTKQTRTCKICEKGRVTLLNRTHFFAIAARLMRRILVDHA